MRRRGWLAVLVFAVSLLGIASISRAGLTDSLMGKEFDSLLSKQLGLTADQSKGGIGAMLGLAKEKLSSADFSKIAAVIPGADKYLSKAKQLGLLDKPLKDKAGLDGAFTKLGIPQDKASKMVPTFTEMVGKVGGDQVKSLLSSALG